MKLYLDASVLVALFTEEPSTHDILMFLQEHQPTLVVSDFAAAEFASAVARRVRTAVLTRAQAQAIFTAFDVWTDDVAVGEIAVNADTRANNLLRRLDLPLRAPDAINIAIAERTRAALFTLDKQMTANAQELKLKVVGL